MQITYQCPACKKQLFYDAERGITQINLTCPYCGKVTLVYIKGNERLTDTPGFKRAAVLGVRLIMKLLGM